MRRPYSEPGREKLIELYVDQLLSPSEIGQIYGMSSGCVFYRIRKCGIKLTEDQMKRVKQRAAKRSAQTDGWKAANARRTETRRRKAAENGVVRKYAIYGSVKCPNCGEERIVWSHRINGWTGRCQKCSRKMVPQTEEWKRKHREIVVPATVKGNTARFTGENNPRWKGGITPANTKIRNSKGFAEWRKAVLNRDNYTCQICQTRGGKLHAHHIETFAHHLELRMAVTNGLTVCEDCHKQIIHRGSWHSAPISRAAIREIQELPVSLDWSEAA